VKRFIRPEASRYRSSGVVMGGIAALTLLSALYFFSAVGRLDDSEDSRMFRDYSSVVALSFTVTLAVVAVYGAVVYSHRVVGDYVGARRIRIYRYPGGRKPLFLAKNVAYASTAAFATGIGVAIGLAVYFLIELFAPMVRQSSPADSLDTIVFGWVTDVVLSTAVVVGAGLVGVRRQSRVATIVTAVVAIALLGNGVALALNGQAWAAGAVSLCVAGLVWALVIHQGTRIDRDEVL
jgi:hypothetical protein